MKKNFKTSLVCLSCLLMLSACEKKQTVLITSDCMETADYSTFNFPGVDCQVAKSIARNYQSIDQPRLQIDPDTKDAACIWFSLENMKAFIWKIESAMCRSGCTDKQLGIRIYYARYPDAATMASNNNLNMLPSDYEYHHTLFMVPTFQDAKSPDIHWDFDPWHLGSADCSTIVPMSEWFRKSEKPFGNEKSLIFSVSSDQYFSEGGNWISVLNHGDLIPPGTNTGAGYYP